MPTSGRYFSYKQISAIAGLTRTNFLFRLYDGAAKSAQIVEFLKAPRSQHKSRIVRDLDSTKGAIQFIACIVLGRLGVQGNVEDQNEMAMYSTLFETHDQTSLDRKRQAEIATTLLCCFDSRQNANITTQRVHPRQPAAHRDDRGPARRLGHASRVLEVHVALRLWTSAVRRTRRVNPDGRPGCGAREV